MTDSDQSSTSNPGLILKAAREELSFTVDSVAHELHLRSSVVKAMEDEDYDTFSSDVFLKGYFRSYCRLVSLHEERMVELLEKQLSKRKQAVDENALKLKKALQSKARKKAMVVFSLVGLIACLGFYLFFLFKPMQDELTDDVKIEASQVEHTETLHNHEALSSIESSDSPSDNTSENVVVTKNSIAVEASTLVGDGQAKEENVKEKIAPKSLQTLPEVQNLKNLEKHNPILDSQDGLAEIETPKVDINVSFSGNCWFKLTDGAGKNVFGALKKAGDSLRYSGISPFTIILGDATKAEIISKGKVVNLKPFTAKNGRAVITLSDRLPNKMSNTRPNE